MILNVDNYNINYIDIGTGEVVLLLHGWGADLNSFNSLINILKNDYRVIAIDYPGFGKSDKLNRSFSVDDYCNIIIKFINLLNIKELILIGHSYGSRIILKLNNKDLNFNIKKNVIIDGAGLKDKKDFKTKFKIIVYKSLKKICLILPITKSLKNKLILHLSNQFGSSDYKNSDKIMKETLIKSVNEDLTYCLKRMKETLLIWGNNDTVTPLWMGKVMESNINNSGLVILNGGHFSYIDDPITFSNVIKSYFKING